MINNVLSRCRTSSLPESPYQRSGPLYSRRPASVSVAPKRLPPISPGSRLVQNLRSKPTKRSIQRADKSSLSINLDQSFVAESPRIKMPTPRNSYKNTVPNNNTMNITPESDVKNTSTICGANTSGIFCNKLYELIIFTFIMQLMSCE